MLESHQTISILLVVLCTLAALDLWRQMALKSEAVWLQHYTAAIKSRYQLWRVGFLTEDLEIKLEHQNDELKQLLTSIDRSLAPRFHFTNPKGALRQNVGNIEFTRAARITIHNMYRNDTSVHYITCKKDGPRLRVGTNDYRSDPRDMCQIFVDPSSEKNQASQSVGPQAMFELVPFLDGAFSLRSIANGQFLRVVPPPEDQSKLPWKVEVQFLAQLLLSAAPDGRSTCHSLSSYKVIQVGGSVAGSAELFRMSEEGYLYSSLMGGFLSCSTGRMLTGYALSAYTSPQSLSTFVLEPVPEDEMHTASMLVDLSGQIAHIQAQARVVADKRPLAAGNEKPLSQVKLAMCVPMTSKGTKMSDVGESPFWSNLFDSFMKSIDWRSNRIEFRFYLGFDQADPLYDTGDAWSELREEFKNRATFRMTEQMMDEAAINEVLQRRLSLKLAHFDHLAGAPSQVVSQLVLQAYADDFDYFYQINDDTVIASPNWPSKLIETLRSNPLLPNLGVTGPTDSNNEKIFTHSFTHRRHVEIFGHLFPPYFKNWWSDDWISTVYGAAHTFRTAEVQIQHNVEAQKTGALNRYEVDLSAQFRLGEELRKGFVQIDGYLKKLSLPRLALPSVCGYIPSVRYIAAHVLDKEEQDLIKAV